MGLKTAAVVLLTALVLASAPSVAAERVLVLNSYHPGYFWSDNIMEGVRTVLGKRAGTEVLIEYMDSKRHVGEAYFDAFAALLAAKYADKPVDLVLTCDDNALDFALRRRDLFGDRPLVFCGIDEADPARFGGRAKVWGVTESYSIAGTLEMALALQPKARDVYLITDSSASGASYLAKARRVEKAYTDRLRMHYLSDQTLEAMLADVAAAPTEAIVIYMIFVRDAAGRVFTLKDSMARVASASPAPVYCTWGFRPGLGVVGGDVTSGVVQGRMAAELAERVLDGRDLDSIPLAQSAPHVQVVDYEALTAEGLSEDRIPPAATVYNRPVSFYQQHRQLIWETVGAFALLLLAFLGVSYGMIRTRRAAAGLRRSRERLKAEKVFTEAIVQSIPGLFMIGDPSRKRYVQRNANWAALTGYTEAELDEMAPLDLFADREGATACMEAVFEGGSCSMENAIVTKAGERIPFLITGKRLVVEDKPYIIGVGMDLTERKRADAEREKLETQLRQAQKMEAVGQLAGGVAHDFNNLLQAILGYGEMARAEVDVDSALGEYVEQIVEAGDRAKTLVSQLLAFSRRQVLNMEDLDLNAVIGDLVKMIRRVIGEHITLNVLPGRELGTVRADRGQIGQILTNLCVNARDAMSAGGEITIETENVRIDDAYCADHAWATPGRYALLSVTDTGCGMDAETLAQAFEPYFTTKAVGQGTGLGLSTVYGLVMQHRGLIHAYSEVGKGSTFKIYLPLIERPAAAVGDKIEGPVPGGTETILLAEDDQRVLRLSKMLLTHAGYSVLTAADGVEALEVFDAHADEIDLALLDVVMPTLGGRAVFEEIRRRRPELPVLFASGYSASAVHTNFILDAGLTLIQKPYQRADLLRKVREVLDKAR